MYWSVLTSVLSMVGSYTSDSTPPATVYQTLDPVFSAVPRQSFLARSKYDSAPGPPGAVAPLALPGVAVLAAAGTANPAPAAIAAAPATSILNLDPRPASSPIATST